MPRGVSPVPELRYPINLLRNVARLGGHPESRFQLVTDVGQVFSQRFLPAVARHVHNRQNNGTEEKVAYIVRWARFFFETVPLLLLLNY